MWLNLLQPWDSLEQGNATGAWTFLLAGISLQAVWQAGQQSLGSLVSQES